MNLTQHKLLVLLFSAVNHNDKYLEMSLSLYGSAMANIIMGKNLEYEINFL